MNKLVFQLYSKLLIVLLVLNDQGPINSSHQVWNQVGYKVEHGYRPCTEINVI